MSFLKKIKAFLAGLKSKYLNNNVFVQLGHGAGGFAMVAAPFLVSRHTAAWKLTLIGLGIVTGWTLPKEFIFDIKVEKATIQDGIIDARSYGIGAALALLLILIGSL